MVVDIILPVLDEAAAIPWVLGHMPAGFDPIVVDNGCSDGSAELAAGLGARVVQEPRRGFGAACFAGLRAATSDVVGFMDCDGSLDPRDLPFIVAPVEAGRVDLVLGSRQPQSGAWPVHAKVANRWLARQVSRQAGVHLTDLGPMRAARRASLLSLDMTDRRSGWPLEMVLRAIGRGWRIEEVPITYRVRAGRSKVTGTVKGTVRAVGDMASVMRRLEVRP